jgi:hypothetical protein
MAGRIDAQFHLIILKVKRSDIKSKDEVMSPVCEILNHEKWRPQLRGPCTPEIPAQLGVREDQMADLVGRRII